MAGRNRTLPRIIMRRKTRSAASGTPTKRCPFSGNTNFLKFMGTDVRSAVVMVTVAVVGPPPTGTGLGVAKQAAPRGKRLLTQLRGTGWENPVPGVILIGNQAA